MNFEVLVHISDRSCRDSTQERLPQKSWDCVDRMLRQFLVKQISW